MRSVICNMKRERTAVRIPIVVLGEKDQGKSTLLGRLFYETGGLPSDRLREIQNAMRIVGKRFERAHLLDAFRYEREHEMTLDTSRIIVEIGRRLYECIDVPGHPELIKNMLSGASEAHYAILVVEAKGGITPQTTLHLEIAKFLGIKKLIAVINKCDLIGYSREQFERKKLEVADALAHTGFGNAPILPLNAATGDNLLARTQRLRWFCGPTLLHAIEKNFRTPTREGASGSLIAAVQDVYPNTMIVGQIVQGHTRRGEHVSLLRGAGRSRHTITNIFVNSEEAAFASPCDHVGFRLAPVPSRIRRGDFVTKKSLGYSRTLSGWCVFTEFPPKNVSVEMGFQKSPALFPRNRGACVPGRPVPITLMLKNKMAMTDRFVIKKDGAAIGVGRTVDD